MTFDISAFRLQVGLPALQQMQGEDGGAIVEGVPRLAQRFCINLMTPAGSVPYTSNLGTNFVPALQNGQARTEGDVLALFAAAMLTLGPNMAGDETVNDPPDECFRSAIITQISLSAASVSLTVRVTNQAGTQISFTLPLDFALGGQQ